MSVPVRTPGDRGLRWYGAGPLVCTYGSKAEVHESSSAEGPHVWLGVEAGRNLRTVRGEAALHLNEEQAQELVARLQAWLDDIPERWADAAVSK